MAMTTAPTLTPIKGGWAALGVGWAVFGETQEQAMDRFLAAVRKHQEIMARPEPTISDPRGAAQSAMTEPE
jgi:hypothetical protein